MDRSLYGIVADLKRIPLLAEPIKLSEKFSTGNKR